MPWQQPWRCSRPLRRHKALYGTIGGTVTDDSGAAIPGATVTVTNQGTGLEVSGITDDTGAYAIRNLQPGTYTVKASLQGFKEYVQTGVPVAPERRRRASTPSSRSVR